MVWESASYASSYRYGVLDHIYWANLRVWPAKLVSPAGAVRGRCRSKSPPKNRPPASFLPAILPRTAPAPTRVVLLSSDDQPPLPRGCHPHCRQGKPDPGRQCHPRVVAAVFCNVAKMCAIWPSSSNCEKNNDLIKLVQTVSGCF